jgi:hypothetical protein
MPRGCGIVPLAMLSNMCANRRAGWLVRTRWLIYMGFFALIGRGYAGRQFDDLLGAIFYLSEALRLLGTT